MDNPKKRKIRILHLHTLPVVSGSGINTFLSMKLVDQEIFEPALGCAPNGKLQDLVIQNNFKFYSITNFVAPVRPLKDLKALFEVYKLLKTSKFDIVHTHNSKAGFIGRLAAKLAGNVKIVHTVHGFAFHSFEKPIKRLMFLILEKLAANWCDYMIFISQPLIDWAQKENLIKCEYSKIYSGIDLSKFREFNTSEKQLFRAKFGLNPDAFIVGEVAKLWDGKGHFTIIEAARILKTKIPNIQFFFVGEGYLKPALEQKIKDYDLTDYFVFSGFIEETAEATAVLDIALLISDYEGMGRVILEAMACNVAVIGSNVGGIPDLIKDQETGLLTPPRNPEKLAENILMLYNDIALREKLKANARKRLTAEFTAQTMADQISMVYKKLMQKK